MAIRLTARTSLLLFLLAFCASSLDFLWPSAATRWIKANRRSFGLAFAFSHLLHAVAIVALSQFNPVLFDELTAPAAFVAGGTAYFVIILMTLTSFDRVSEIVGATDSRYHPQWWYLVSSAVFRHQFRPPRRDDPGNVLALHGAACRRDCCPDRRPRPEANGANVGLNRRSLTPSLARFTPPPHHPHRPRVALSEPPAG